MSEIIRYLSFSVCLISLSIIPLRSIHVVTNGKIHLFKFIPVLFFFFQAALRGLWDLSSLIEPRYWKFGVLTTGPPGNS